MRPDDLLTIFELRADDEAIRAALEPPALEASLAEALGVEAAGALVGIHFEADFAFLFFGRPVDLDPWLAARPELSLRQVHSLRYDQWQDGAAAQAIRLGVLDVVVDPDGAGVPPGDSGAGGVSAAGDPEGCPDDSGRRSGAARAASPGAPSGPKRGRTATLTIDPGLAFGFGGHPTTRACLEFLIRLFHPHLISPEPIPRVALDLGCGTGVLALAALTLGAERALGVDHSHLAVEAARKNAQANGLGGRVELVRGLAQDFASFEADLVMANIPMFVLRDLVELGAFQNRRRLIVSGLLPEEGQAFLDLLSGRLAFKVLDSQRSDRWISYLLAPARE